MKYKILSLDGGGSWSLIQARVLLDIYGDIRGHALLKEFDMVIANSGGSLVLACLCNDMTISEVISVLGNEKDRKQIFSPLTPWERMERKNFITVITRIFTKALGPRYRMKRKLEGLQRVLTEYDHLKKEGKIDTPIVNTELYKLPAIIGKPSLQILIVGYDYFRRRVSFFRSNQRSLTDGFSKYYSITLGHAIHCSSNAPVNYFDSPAEVQIARTDTNDTRTSWYWDGAVSGFNNPVLAGLVEAYTNNYLSQPEYCILSIGTSTGSPVVLTDAATSTDPVVKNEALKNAGNKFALTDTSLGFLKDIKKLSTSILGDPPDSATFIAYCFLDPSLTNKANLVRINPCMQVEKDGNGIYGPPMVYRNMNDGVQRFQDLLDLDMDAVEDKQVALIKELCDKFIVTDNGDSLPNQLIRGSYPKNAQDKETRYLGHPTYKLAKEQWMKCK